MEIHFLNVGCGTMVLMILPNDKLFIYDCNITNENASAVFDYLAKIIGPFTEIDVFINSHRDTDHIKGIKALHSEHPIKEIWDANVPGTTTNSSDYYAYMELRRSLKTKVIKARTYREYGNATLRYMNSRWKDYDDPNDQSIVLKIEYRGSSAMLAGDTSLKPWKEKILTYYSDIKLKSNILLASHHGSISFFDDPEDEQYYYEDHIKKINPSMTIISVGPNSKNLPDNNALDIYKKHSTGSNKGNKIFTTEDKGNMKLILKGGGAWSLKTKQ